MSIETFCLVLFKRGQLRLVIDTKLCSVTMINTIPDPQNFAPGKEWVSRIPEHFSGSLRFTKFSCTPQQAEILQARGDEPQVLTTSVLPWHSRREFIDLLHDWSSKLKLI